MRTVNHPNLSRKLGTPPNNEEGITGGLLPPLSPLRGAMPTMDGARGNPPLAIDNNTESPSRAQQQQPRRLSLSLPTIQQSASNASPQKLSSSSHSQQQVVITPQHRPRTLVSLPSRGHNSKAARQSDEQKSQKERDRESSSVGGKKRGPSMTTTIATTTTVGCYSPFQLSPEVKDKLSASLVALKKWSQLNHPTSTVNFAKKIYKFCESAADKCGYVRAGYVSRPSVTESDANNSPAPRQPARVVTSLSEVRADTSMARLGASACLAPDLLRAALSDERKGEERSDSLSRPTDCDSLVSRRALGRLCLDDQATEVVGSQAFAFCLAPLYHVPLPSLTLRTLRLRCEALTRRIDDEKHLGDEDDFDETGSPAVTPRSKFLLNTSPRALLSPRAADKASYLCDSADSPPNSEQNGSLSDQQLLGLKLLRTPLRGRGNEVVWCATKRNALVGLLRGVQTITQVELVFSGSSEEECARREGNVLDLDNVLDLVGSSYVSSAGDGTDSVLSSAVLDVPFLRDILLPLLKNNRLHTQKVASKLRRDTRKALKTRHDEEMRAVTAALCNDEALDRDAIVVEEAKARHKLAASCQIHKGRAKTRRIKRLLEERFIAEQHSVMSAEAAQRSELCDYEVHAVRGLVYALFESDVEEIASIEVRERKAIRDAHYLKSYEIRRFLNTMVEQRRTERGEVSDFERKMRAIISDDESQRRAALQSAHEELLSATVKFQTHLVAHSRRLDAIRAAEHGSPTGSPRGSSRGGGGGSPREFGDTRAFRNP